MNARAELLAGAEAAVNGDRNGQYGDPRQDFQRTADMWAAYLGVEVKQHDVAAMMCMLKISRIRWSPEKFDSWMDLAGYAACGWDCASGSVPPPDPPPAHISTSIPVVTSECTLPLGHLDDCNGLPNSHWRARLERAQAL